jgi:hypothetical protein
LENDFALKAMLEGSEVTKRGNKYWMNHVQGPFYALVPVKVPGLFRYLLTGVFRRNSAETGIALNRDYLRMFQTVPYPAPAATNRIIKL